MTTAIWEDGTYIDQTFIRTGNVESQIHACVVPHRRPDRSETDTKADWESQNKTIWPLLLIVICLGQETQSLELVNWLRQVTSQTKIENLTWDLSTKTWELQTEVNMLKFQLFLLE